MTYHNAHKYILTSPDALIGDSQGGNLRKLWTALGNPQRNIKYLRLAGSNGKTVCAEMLMSVYQDSKFKLGCLTTSLRSDLRDNIHIDGKHLSYEKMASYIERIYKTATVLDKKSREENEESFLLTKQDILLTTALLAFKESECDLCVIESDHKHTDPTVFLPHPFAVAICGTIPCNSKADIGMIRSYICHGIEEIVSAPQDKLAYQIISDSCAAVNCRLTIPTKSQLKINKLSLSGSEFTYRESDYKLSMCGKFQINNAVFVIELLKRLSTKGFSLSEEKIKEGLQRTRIPARFEILSIVPTIIVDSTHSDIAIPAVCESMHDFQGSIGSKIRLCLPDGAIIDKYVSALSEQGYETGNIIVFSKADDGSDHQKQSDRVYCRKMKDLVKRVLADLTQEETLLISGPSAFTLEVRYELLEKLGY